MSHYIGGFFKYLAAALIFIFSMSLGFSFFTSIAPANMPWFTLAAMGLTEFGLICWLAVFMLQRHHDAHKTLAFIMIFVCAIAVVGTDAMELARQFGTVFFLAPLYYYGLIVVFCAHLLALITDFFISYFAVHPFTGQPSPSPKGGETVDPLEQTYYQTATTRPQRPARPRNPNGFWSRMKVAIAAFSNSNPAQQQEMQSE
jgi:hypothetical protein